jgi:hypothetical protein
MPISNNIYKKNLTKYSDKNGKISRSIKSGELKRLKRGLYETDPSVSACSLASSMYGPSYLSFDYALYYYGMIPERVVVYTSATFDKKKKKSFDTYFGTFTYRDVPSSVYPYGVRLEIDGSTIFQIATEEKALCDKLYTIPPMKNIIEMQDLLLHDLRIDEDSLNSLDIESIGFLASKYHSTNVSLLYKFLRRWKHE